MEWIALLLKLAHIGLALTLVAGLIGRFVVLSRAAREDRVDRVAELTDLAGPFERLVVRSSLAILPVGMATAWAQGYEWLGLTTGWMLVTVVIYLTDTSGNVISWGSAGLVGFKGSRKSTPFAASQTADLAAKKAMEHGMRQIEVYVKGPGAGREQAIRSLQTAGLDVTAITDVTPIPHNGCRPPKRRRV